MFKQTKNRLAALNSLSPILSRYELLKSNAFNYLEVK